MRRRASRTALLLAAGMTGLAIAPQSVAGQELDSLLGAARRAALAWQRHDFSAMLAGSPGVVLHLPGTDPSSPLRPEQAAELLRAFAGGDDELSVEVVVARDVGREQAYVEARRTFTVRGGTAQRVQTVYLGMRQAGGAYRVVEVRVVP